MTVTDTLARPLRDLRISVTDRWEFRCPCCMPREVFGELPFMERSEISTFEEIERLTGIFARSTASRKIRLTGGDARPPRPRPARRTAGAIQGSRTSR